MPLPQCPMHVPPMQYGVAPEHAVVHEPQCAGVVTSVSQPVDTMPSQSRQPGSQLPIVHALATHDPVACGGAQGIPHPPQCAASVAVSTQLPPHTSGRAGGQLAVQA